MPAQPDKQPAKPPVSLTTQQRAERVLAAQGMAIGRLGSFTAAQQSALSVLCSEQGQLDPELRTKFQAIRDDYYATHKAVVDDGVPAPESE